jgi:hypothetical protein
MNYSIHGPFEIKTKNNSRLVDRRASAKKAFWSTVDNEEEFLPASCGCYLFAIRASKGIKPWYVGLAAKQPFEKECFTASKINIYNDVLANGKGTPILFLVSKRTKSRKLVRPSKKSRHRATTYLETVMIGAALEKNPELMNIKKIG